MVSGLKLSDVCFSERAAKEAKERAHQAHQTLVEVAAMLPQDISDCGILACRPFLIQSCANIKVKFNPRMTLKVFVSSL